MTAAEIRTLMRQRFATQASAIFFEVPDATGARHAGFADAISMSLWPSHGLEIHGYEIKVSKYDWRSELNKPEKAERFAKRCDRWWLVTSAGVVEHENEIPPSWGWMLASADGLKVVRQPAKLEPLPLDRYFLAALLRSAGKVDALLVKREADRLVEQQRESIRFELEDRAERQKDLASKDTAIMAKLRAALGDDAMWAWQISEDDIVAAVVSVHRSGVARSYGNLATAAKTLEDAAARIRGAHESLALPEPPKKTTKRRR